MQSTSMVHKVLGSSMETMEILPEEAAHEDGKCDCSIDASAGPEAKSKSVVSIHERIYDHVGMHLHFRHRT